MPSKSLQSSETPTIWTDSGGDKLLDLGGLSSSGGSKVGAYLDLGASPRTDWYEVVLKIDGYASNPSSDDTIELWFTQSNSTTGFDGQLTTDPTSSSEGSISSGQEENLKFVFIIQAVSTVASNILQSRCLVKLTARYISPVVFNRSNGSSLNASGDSHTLVLTPVPQEGQ